jgi:hypothetical protein
MLWEMLRETPLSDCFDGPHIQSCQHDANIFALKLIDDGTEFAVIEHDGNWLFYTEK